MDPPITISGKCWFIFWPRNLNCDHKITIQTLFSAKKILFIVVQTEPQNKFLPHVYTFLLKDPRCSPIIIHLTYKPQQYLSIYQSISIYYYLLSIYQSISKPAGVQQPTFPTGNSPCLAIIFLSASCHEQFVAKSPNIHCCQFIKYKL